MENFDKHIRDPLNENIEKFKDLSVDSFTKVKDEIWDALQAEWVLEKNYSEYWVASFKFEQALESYADFL